MGGGSKNSKNSLFLAAKSASWDPQLAGLADVVNDVGCTTIPVVLYGSELSGQCIGCRFATHGPVLAELPGESWSVAAWATVQIDGATGVTAEIVALGSGIKLIVQVASTCCREHKERVVSLSRSRARAPRAAPPHSTQPCLPAPPAPGNPHVLRQSEEGVLQLLRGVEESGHVGIQAARSLFQPSTRGNLFLQSG